MPITQYHPKGREPLSTFTLEKSGKGLKLVRQEECILPLTNYHVQGHVTLSLIQPGSYAHQLAEVRLGHHKAPSHQNHTRLRKILQRKGMLLAEGDW